MNLRSLDLNLLVVLDALIEEAHVSRAADRLGLSQPATSSALERCRHLFRDPLLERGKNGMRPTPKAQALRVPLKNLLAEIAKVVDPPHVALADLRQTIRITMADLPGTLLAAPLHAELSCTAPGIDLVIQPWHGAVSALDGLAKGSIDLAVSVFPNVDASFRCEELVREHYVVAMRKTHPAVVGFDLDRWLAYPHILVSGRGETRGTLDQALLPYGRTRRVGMVVPSFLLATSLLLDSDLIAMLPSRCLPPLAPETLAVLTPPIPVEGFPLHLALHSRRDGDEGLQYVASACRRIFAKS
jgi:DNA-binding transcriptional LysR family regulator